MSAPCTLTMLDVRLCESAYRPALDLKKGHSPRLDTCLDGAEASVTIRPGASRSRASSADAKLSSRSAARRTRLTCTERPRGPVHMMIWAWSSRGPGDAQTQIAPIGGPSLTAKPTSSKTDIYDMISKAGARLFSFRLGAQQPTLKLARCLSESQDCIP